MKTTTKVFGGLTAIVITGVAIAGTTTEAYRGDPNVKGPAYTEERHEKMEKAFETGDYEAWVKLMEGRGRVIQVINADNFDRFVEAQKLAKNGQIEESKAIRAELGLGLKNGSGKGQGQGRGQGKKGGNRGGNQTGPKNGSGPNANTDDCTYNQ